MASVVRIRCFFFAVSTFVFTSFLLAQSAGTGALTGTVTDPAGGVVPGAQVTLVSTDTNQSRTASTGADGSYKFALLPPGTYRVRFSAVGFKTAEVSAIAVNVTETPVLDRALEVGAQSEQVTVEAQTEILQAATSTLGTRILQRFQPSAVHQPEPPLGRHPRSSERDRWILRPDHVHQRQPARDPIRAEVQFLAAELKRRQFHHGALQVAHTRHRAAQGNPDLAAVRRTG